MEILYSCNLRSCNQIEKSGFQLDKRVIRRESLGFHDYNYLQMNAAAVIGDSRIFPEESSFFTSVGYPFPAVCIRTSTERSTRQSLFQVVDFAIAMNADGYNGIPIPVYVEDVSYKVVNKMVWRKF